MTTQDTQQEQRAEMGGDLAIHGAHPTEKPVRGPGVTRFEELAGARAPTAEDVAALVVAYPAERGAILEEVQQRFGNALAEQALRGPGALPTPAEVDGDTAARELVARGINDEVLLTDELFWRRYPALRDLKLVGGTPAAAEWMHLRDQLARPALSTHKPPHEVEAAPPEIKPAVQEVKPVEEAGGGAEQKAGPAPEVGAGGGGGGGGGGGAPAPALAEGPSPQPTGTPPVHAPEPPQPVIEPVAVKAAPEPKVAEPEAAPTQVDAKAEPRAETAKAEGDPDRPVVEANAGPAKFPDPKTIKTKESEAKILNHLRDSENRFDPEWMIGFQHALGAEATGAFNTDTLRKLEAKAAEAHVDHTAMLKEAFLVSIHPGQPFFAGEKPANRTHKHSEAAGGTANRDKCARYAGRADFNAWKSEWVDIKLLDITLGEGHPVLAKRVEAASAFLRARHPGEKDPDIRKAIGWEHGEGNAAYFKFDCDMHNMGLALDINPKQNAWFFRGGGAIGHDKWNMEVFAEAAHLFGGESITPGMMKQLADSKSTEELWATLHQSSESVARYISLCKRNKQGALEEDHFKAELKKIKPDMSDANVEKAYEFAKQHDVDKYFHDANLGQDQSRSFMNHSEDMLVALRDAAGLAWGGAEISGSVNGDFMHFDMRNSAGLGGEVWEMVAHVNFGSGLSKKGNW
ncbi:MAG TPA: hypothetical protein VHE35_04785 [Kofleriaceae bacterium]|nr:hypothetical protein [Kofleriaceae bacterium]